jgi:hypothetical protein
MDGPCRLPWRPHHLSRSEADLLLNVHKTPPWATSRREGIACYSNRHLPSLWFQQQSSGATLWSQLIKPSPFPSFWSRSVTVDFIFITMPVLRKLIIFPLTLTFITINIQNNTNTIHITQSFIAEANLDWKWSSRCVKTMTESEKYISMLKNHFGFYVFFTLWTACSKGGGGHNLVNLVKQPCIRSSSLTAVVKDAENSPYTSHKKERQKEFPRFIFFKVIKKSTRFTLTKIA